MSIKISHLLKDIKYHYCNIIVIIENIKWNLYMYVLKTVCVVFPESKSVSKMTHFVSRVINF